MTRSRFKIWGITIIIVVVFLMVLATTQAVDWNALLKQTYPEAERFTQVTDLANLKSRQLTKTVFPAYKGNTQVGVIYYAAPRGYQSELHTLVALDMNGTIRKVNIISQAETPAYVVPLQNGTYQRQFEGITLLDKLVFLVGTRPAKRGEVQSIAGATESAKPVAIAVSEARKLFAEMYRK